MQGWLQHHSMQVSSTEYNTCQNYRTRYWHSVDVRNDEVMTVREKIFFTLCDFYVLQSYNVLYTFILDYEISMILKKIYYSNDDLYLGLQTCTYNCVIKKSFTTFWVYCPYYPNFYRFCFIYTFLMSFNANCEILFVD